MNKQLEVYNETQQEDPVVHISEAVGELKGYADPFSLGYPALDEAMLGGVRPGDLIVICGPPGHGKTTLAMNISANLSKQSLPSVWFSFEVTLRDLYAHFQEMGGADKDLLVYTPKKNSSGNLKWIKLKIKEGIEKFNTKFVFIDDLDALSPTNTRGLENKRLILAEICQELKNMAIEMEIVIFFMAHVNKMEEGKEITLRDIAETSGVAQKVNFAIAVKRLTERRMTNGTVEEIKENRSMIKILKNRLTGQEPKFYVTLEKSILLPI